MRRTRSRVGDRQVEVVNYEVAPAGIRVRHWAPTSYWAIGQQVEVPVRVRVYQGKHGPGYVLEVPSDSGEEF